DPVAVNGMCRRVQQQLCMYMTARGQAFAFKQGDPPGDVLGAKVDVYRRPVPQLTGFAGQQRKFDIDTSGGGLQFRFYQPVAAADVVHRKAFATEVEGNALASMRVLGLVVLSVQPAYANVSSGRAQRQLIADLNLAGKGGAGHDDAGSGHAEG